MKVLVTGSDGVLGLSFTGDYIPITESESVLMVLHYTTLDENALCIPENTNEEEHIVISGPSVDGSGLDLTDQFIIHYESTCP